MKKYSGFTLIEMLIVMGIIIILMAAGIAGGRFALQRANRIQKQSAVDNIEQSLWGYYSDNRRFPRPDTTFTVLTPELLLTEGALLADYIDAGQFDGGADGSFYYFVDATGQEFVICATFGGFADEMSQGVYCNGNGITGGNVPPFTGNPVDIVAGNVYENGDGSTVYGAVVAETDRRSNWDAEARDWQ